MNKTNSIVRMPLTLDNERCIPIRMEIAAIIGLNESIIIQQIHYWNCKNESNNNNYAEGHYWTYNTMKQWCETFPCFSLSTIERIFSNLEKKGLIISKKLHADKTNRTKWYRIDYEKLNYVLNGGDENQGNACPQNEGMAIIGKNQTFAKEPINNDANNLRNNAFPHFEGMHFLKMRECINTENNYTENKERDARARKESLQDWKPSDTDILKTKYNLSDDDIAKAILEFKLDHNAKGRLWADTDAAFELWCSRFAECKKRYQKPLKRQQDISSNDNGKAFCAYIAKELQNALGNIVEQPIDIEFLKTASTICVNGNDALSQHKNKIIETLLSIKNIRNEYFNQNFAIELYHMKYLQLNSIRCTLN